MSDQRLLTKLPGPFGYSAALDRMGTAAAPLLAGFAFTLIGLVLVGTAHLAQPEVTLLLLVLAALLLITAVQLAFAARKYYIPAEEYVALLEISDTEAAQGSLTRSELQAQYAKWLPTHSQRLHLARLTYNAGIVLLLAGVSVALVPPGRLSHVPPARLAAVAAAAAGALAEFLFVALPAAEDVLRGLGGRGGDPGGGPRAGRDEPSAALAPEPADAKIPGSTSPAPGPIEADAQTKPAGAPAPPPGGSGGSGDGRMPGWIFAVELAWLVLLIALFITYTSSHAVRQALPARLGGSIPVTVPWFGALGGCLISLTGIFAYNRHWDASYDYWHAIRPLVGAVTGGMGCVLLLITTQAATTGTVRTDATFYEGVAFVFGFAEEAFRSLVSRVTTVLLKPGG